MHAGPYTYVTGFVNLHDLEQRQTTKTVDEYLHYSIPLLTSGVPFVCFCHSAYVDTLKYLIGDFQSVKIVPFDVSDLHHNTPEFFQNTALPANRSVAKDTHWYMVTQLQKAYWMKEVAAENPYGTTHLCWVDFGINYIMNKTSAELCTVLQDIPITDRITLGSCEFPLNGISDFRAFMNNFHSFVLGGVVAAPMTDISWFAQEQNDTVAELVKMGVIAWETSVWMFIVYAHPSRFALYPASFSESIIRNMHLKEALA